MARASPGGVASAAMPTAGRSRSRTDADRVAAAIPASNPHHPPAVEVRETHASRVFQKSRGGALLGEPQHLHRVRDRRRSVCRAETQLAIGVSDDRADPA